MVRRIGALKNSPVVKVVGMRSSMPYANTSTTNMPIGLNILPSKLNLPVEDASRDVMKTAKPSEIRAASKAARAAVKFELEKRKVEKDKQERLLKEQQAAQMKMNKIRAEIAAIKEKEKAIEKGTLTIDCKALIDDDASSTSDDGICSLKENNSGRQYESSGGNGFKKLEQKELYEVRKGQLERAVSREKVLMSSSNHVPEMRRKACKSDLFFCPERKRIVVTSSSASESEHPQLTPTRSPVSGKRSCVIPITQEPPLGIVENAKKVTENQKMHAQLKKLEEAKGYFKEGYRLCWKFQDSDKALKEYRKALFIREGLLGKYHEETGRTYYWIGRSLRKLKEYEEALFVFSRASRIFDRVLAQNHKYCKWTKTAIVDTFKEMELPDVYYESYKNDLDESVSHEVKGDNFRKSSSFPQAISEYRAAIETIQDSHPDRADLHSKIAIILRKMGEFEKALQENQYALEIYELSLGPEHPETVKTLNQMMEKKRLDQVSLALQEKLNIRS